MIPRLAIIIPVQNEADCLGDVLTELSGSLNRCKSAKFQISVGLNACNDNSREIAEGFDGILIGETKTSGYGHGCMAAIEALSIEPDAYIFYAGDGANDPEDLLKIVDIFVSEKPPPAIIMGVRKFELRTWLQEFGRALPNLILGLCCAVLGGQFFTDLGPLRLIDRDLFERIDPQELEWGWTIEAQIMAARFQEIIRAVEVSERPRLRGTQKVSGVSLRRSAVIGGKIIAAAIRTRFRNV